MSSTLGIYIHFPYCKSKCPYCDFNSHVRPVFDENQWMQGILSEIQHTPKRQVTSIFFGGGTPSLMSPNSTGHIIDALAKKMNLTDNVEITLEANPNSAEAIRFQGFRQAGVNRISIGVQSFNQDQLKFLGRQHSVQEGIDAIHNAKRYFDRISFDLIYALPHQTLSEWAQELEYALSFGTTHLSLYQLTIEPETPFEKRYHRKEFAIPLDHLSAQFYEQTVQQMTLAGLPPYEVSNFAQPGQACRHNLCYWQYDDYLGFGPGAHGRFKQGDLKIHTINPRLPETWIQDPVHGKQTIVIDEKQQIFERLMMGLRLFDGILKPNIAPYIDLELLADLEKEGYLFEDTTQLIPTLKGILCHGSIVNYITNDLS